MLKIRHGESEEEFNQRVEKYFDKAQQLKQTDLARYVLHRKYILELLGEALYVGNDGKYCKEEKVHEIIMPMRVTSDDAEFLDNNLWIIDERLVFHHYLASDKSFKKMSITDCDSSRRPDLIIENIYDNPLLVTEKRIHHMRLYELLNSKDLCVMIWSLIIIHKIRLINA